ERAGDRGDRDEIRRRARPRRAVLDLGERVHRLGGRHRAEELDEDRLAHRRLRQSSQAVGEPRLFPHRAHYPAISVLLSWWESTCYVRILDRWPKPASSNATPTASSTTRSAAATSRSIRSPT